MCDWQHRRGVASRLLPTAHSRTCPPPSTPTIRAVTSASLGHNEQISQVFLASDKQLRPNRNGNLYLQVELSDRSGTVNSRMWNASDNDYKAFDNGDYVHVEGATQLFQGNMQLIANRIRKARPDEVDEADFVTLQSEDVDKMRDAAGRTSRRHQVCAARSPRQRLLARRRSSWTSSAARRPA